MRKVSEHDVGTCKMVDDLEAAFQESCKHNDTTPNDMEYFRRYVFNLICMMANKIGYEAE